MNIDLENCTILNTATNERTFFHATDLREWRGHLMVAGYATAHDVKVSTRGVIPAGERGSSFVINQRDDDEIVAAWVNKHRGLPLVVQNGIFIKQIMNWAICRDDECEKTECKLYHGPPGVKIAAWTVEQMQAKNAAIVKSFEAEKSQLIAAQILSIN